VCLLLLHHRTRLDAPVVLLANRDEDRDRAFDPPSLRGPAGILAPTDRRAGGTWLGVNRAGLVAAVTNRPRGSAPAAGVAAPSGARSRGRLAADVLESPDVPHARRFLERHLLANAYEPFNLLVVDRRSGFVLHRGPEGLAWHDVSPGVHVLTNLHDWDVAPVPAEGRPRAAERLDDLVARLERLAGDRETPLPGEHRICKTGGSRGTVCGAVVALPADRSRAPLFRFANGPPDRTPFETVSA
jgi:uncharacterized protein with NRDE domain